MKLTAGRLAVFDECRLKYHYSYHLKLPRPNVNPHAALGIVVHKALEIFYRDFSRQSLILPNIKWLEECYELAWKEYRVRLLIDEYDKLRRIGWEGLLDYYSRHISSDGGQTGRFESPFLVEQRFRARVQTGGFWVTLTGRFDRLDWMDYEKATLRLVEYKTTRRAPSKDDDPRFRIQLGFYQWAVQEIYGYGLREVSFHYVLAGKEIVYQCKPEYREMIESIAGLVLTNEEHEDEEEPWSPMVGSHCMSCDFRRYCVAANPQAEAPAIKPRPKQLKLF